MKKSYHFKVETNQFSYISYFEDNMMYLRDKMDE